MPNIDTPWNLEKKFELGKNKNIYDTGGHPRQSYPEDR